MISEDTIKRIAHLARLELTDEESKLYSHQLGAIVDYVSELSKVKTEGVEPLVTATDMTATYWDDRVEPYPHPEELLQNAPDKSGNLFKVPPVL